MALNKNKNVQEGQTTINEEITAQEEPKPAENPTPVNEPTMEPETPEKNNDVKEDKKTLRRWVGEKLITSDDKSRQKKADKLAKKQEKLQAKEAKKAQKDESTGWSKVKKGLVIGGSVLGAALVGGVAYVANKSTDDNAVYVDNGDPTCYIPDQTQTPVEETCVEPAVAENIPSESAGTMEDATSN